MTVACRKCGYIYLSLPQDKLLLGASLFKQQLRQQQQQQLAGSGQPPGAAAAPPAEEAQAAAAAAAAASAQVAAAAAAVQAAAMQAAAAQPAAVVDAADVLFVVAEASGIPVQHLSQSDWQPLSELEARLRARVAGQAGAVGAVAGAVRLGRLGLQRDGRPLASLLLTGPAGVGKATLCRALAEELFGSDRHLLRFNLAEFGDRASGEGASCRRKHQSASGQLWLALCAGLAGCLCCTPGFVQTVPRLSSFLGAALLVQQRPTHGSHPHRPTPALSLSQSAGGGSPRFRGLRRGRPAHRSHQVWRACMVVHSPMFVH